MPEETNQNPQDQGKSQPAQGQGSDQSTDPQWLSAIADEAMRDEARKGWMQQADYTQKTQELANQRKEWESQKEKYETALQQNEKFNKWYQDEYAPFVSKLQPHWGDIESILSGQAPRQPASNPANPQNGNAGNTFDNWDLLAPNEQVAKLTEHLQQSYLTPAIENLGKEFDQRLQQREQYYQNYINILTDAFMKKSENPGLDIPAYMNKAMEIQSGRIDPMKMAYEAVTSGDTRKQLEKQWYEQGKRDFEQELKNKQQEQGALQNSHTPSFRGKAATRAEVEQSAREAAAKIGLPWVG